jgi:glycosyltransferase involved in cell wall biosynthesis
VKIAYLHDYFTTPQGSSGTRSYEFAKRLVKCGYEVSILCTNHDRFFHEDKEFNNDIRKLNIDGINVIQFNVPYSNKLSFNNRMIAFLKQSYLSVRYLFKNEFDIVYASSPPISSGLTAIIYKIFKRKKVIFEIRDSWPEVPIKLKVLKNPIIIFLSKLLEKLIYKFSSAFVVLSPGAGDRIRELGFDKKDIVLIPNGCDTEFFKPIFNKEYKSINAVYFGAHGYANGLDYVINFSKWLQKNQFSDTLKINIHLIGDGMLKQSLISEASSSSIENIFFHDPVMKEDLPNFLKKIKANVGLQLLRNEEIFYYGTSPNKFFDYLSLGLPVINNYEGWVANMISDNRLGIAVEHNSFEQLYNAFITLSDEEKSLTFSSNAREFAEINFSREILFEKLKKLIENV